MKKLRLYHYWRSGTSWRVRWAFHLKNISCEYIHINLLKEDCQKNPLGYVPVLEFLEPDKDKPKYLSESLAIIEWVEETASLPSLLPSDPVDRAWVRQLAEFINTNIHPLQNLAAAEAHSENENEQKNWIFHWVSKGLGAYEKLIQNTAGLFSFKDTLTLADLCLIPLCYNAKRRGFQIETFPIIYKIYQRALETESCKKSAPEQYDPN